MSSAFQSIPSCSIYDFDLAIATSPCAAVQDDVFEPNDDCATATPLTDGHFPGLQVSHGSPDFYRFCVPDGATLQVDIDFLDADGDLDLYLYDLNASLCGYTGSGGGAFRSTTNNDGETLTWYNSHGTAKDMAILVIVDDPEREPCNTYGLTLSGIGNCVGAVTVTYCQPMDPNSTGQSTYLGANHGSGQQSGLRLQGFNGPPGQFAYFLVGTGASSPGLSLGGGRLCLRTAAPNQIGRYNIAGTNRNSLGQFDTGGIFQNLSGTSTLGSGFDVPLELPLAGTPIIQIGST